MSNVHSRFGVMLIDDHAMVRHGITSLIEATKDLHVVAEADNEHDALALLANKFADINVILLDLSLKDVANIDFIRQLDAAYHIPILIVSMHDELIYAARALKAGAQGYVMKQEPGEVLIEAIRTVLSGRIYLSASMTDAMLRGQKDAENSPEQLVDNLTPVELDVLHMIANGLSSAEMAKLKNRSIKTIESHRANIRVKLHLKDSADVIRFAARRYPT